MTPLAHEIVKDSLLPVKLRRHDAVMKQLALLHGVHFFECSAVADAAGKLVTSKTMGGLRERLCFLPAPRTWLERTTRSGQRFAFLLEQRGADVAMITTIGRHTDGRIAILDDRLGLPLSGSDLESGSMLIYGTASATEEEANRGTIYMKQIYGLLAMINTPRVIMRQQHMPHRGLERALIANRRTTGKYPVGAWSELLLKVQPPDIDDTDHEAHLTGARALHFCRAHLRIKLGRLELVSAHWRGDPALGIKQTRYRLAA